jgi:hypothetical protein
MFIIGMDKVLPPGIPESIGSLNFHLLEKNSKHYWWKNLFFIQNLFLEKTLIHLPWTWTIAADFQFYLVSLLIVFVYTKNKTAAISGVFVMVLLSCVYNVYLTNYYETLLDLFEMTTNLKYLHLIYCSFWIRFPTFFIGVVFGFLYRLCKDKENIVRDQTWAFRLAGNFRSFVHNPAFHRKFYLFSVFLHIFLCVFPIISEYVERSSILNVSGILYLGFSRVFFILSIELGWVLF